jgi:predicted acylesterase/phospholipase RssA
MLVRIRLITRQGNHMNRRNLEQHLDSAISPKRILALDGGGLRGVMTLAFLKKIEDILRERTGEGANFRLSDYYDLIGGTSTGSIIAAGLAMGMSVDEIRDHYFDLGDKIFKPGLFHLGLLVQQYDAGKVAAALKAIFGERTLGSSDFKTGLMVMSKRLDTGSPWPLTNNPRASHFNQRAGSSSIPNKDYPVWSVVRASTAAPTYFDPEAILITPADPASGAAAVQGEFIDGGVSTANNPALQLVLTATVNGYGFGWEMGADKLAVTSVGTGRANPALGLSSGLGSVATAHAVKALKAVLDDCADLVECMMQWMSHSPTARVIDRDLGSLEGNHIGAGPCLSYLRYNVHFESEWFSEHLRMSLSKEVLDGLAKMDKPANMTQLEAIGRQAADLMVDPNHFPRLEN